MASGKLGKLEYQLFKLHGRANGWVVGKHPFTKVFHHQWVMDRLLWNFAKENLSNLAQGSKILDVGCGNGPYWDIRPDLAWSGIEIYTTPRSTHLINPDGTFPIADGTFDFALCTQVIEHVENPDLTLSEIERVLKCGGVCIINMPFLYPFHGMPHDFRRWTTEELSRSSKNFEIVRVGTIGGVGSSLSTIFLNWVQYQSLRSTLGKILSLALTPFFWLLCLIINTLGLFLDRFDSTESFPTNTYIVLKKVSAQT